MFINKGIYCRIYMYILKSRIANKEKELFQDIAMNACFELFFLWYSSLWCTLEKVLYFIYIKDFIWLWYFCDAKELYANVISRINCDNFTLLEYTLINIPANSVCMIFGCFFFFLNGVHLFLLLKNILFDVCWKGLFGNINIVNIPLTKICKIVHVYIY